MHGAWRSGYDLMTFIVGGRARRPRAQSKPLRAWRLCAGAPLPGPGLTQSRKEEPRTERSGSVFSQIWSSTLRLLMMPQAEA